MGSAKFPFGDGQVNGADVPEGLVVVGVATADVVDVSEAVGDVITPIQCLGYLSQSQNRLKNSVVAILTTKGTISGANLFNWVEHAVAPTSLTDEFKKLTCQC